MFLKKWWFILRYFLFWMVIFAFYRLLFIILYYSKFQNDSFLSIVRNFYEALYLDASAACYILALPTLLIGLAYLFQNYKFIKAVNVYTIIFIFLYGFIALGEDGIYSEWGTKLNYQALSHFLHFSEVLSTISNSLLVSFFLGGGVFGGLFTWWYWKKIRLEELYTELKYPVVRFLLGVIVLLIDIVAVFTGIRGGWAPIPISQSVSYYSNNPVLNDAAVNTGWNLISNIGENFDNLNQSPFIAMPLKDAKAIVDDLYKVKKDTTLEILTTSKPNICFIILESWSAQMVASCGGMDGITPNFDSLSAHGVLFENMITSATSSEQGIAAILSGYPHTNRLFFTHQSEKSKHIGCLNKSFKEKGYTSAFYFGGQLNYGNIRSYLFTQNFDIIKEGKDFDESLPRARLGIHDEEMVKQYASGLSTAIQPFFYCMFTLSSHMPYDIPVTPKFDHLKEEGEYASSVNYCDASLGTFFKSVEKMPWYKNTLFVLVADHSHNSPVFNPMQSAEFGRIPCLFFGEVIKSKYRGTHIKRRVMQADIASTVLQQCKVKTTEFPWSRNMLNPYTPQWAFYPVQLGGGFADSKHWVSFDTYKNSFFLSSSTDSTEVKKLRKKGEAMQQVLFDEFLRF